jgi:hypothetical protein
MIPTNFLAVLYENIIYIIISMFLMCVGVTSFINYYYYNIKFVTKDKRKPITTLDNAEQSFVTVSVCFIFLFIFYSFIKEYYMKPLIQSKLNMVV